jgi:5-methylcytosine-specific restriction endonuclease McrA
MAKIRNAKYLRWKKKNQKPNTNIKGWSVIRKNIIERDSYICRICGDDLDLHVHHIDSNRSNNDNSNLVTLCRDCHMAIHEERYVPWEHDDYPCPWGVIEPNPQKP